MPKISSYADAASVATTDSFIGIVGGVSKEVTVAVLQTAVLTGGTALSLGVTPAEAGAIRLESATLIAARNAANTADVGLVGLDASNQCFVGCHYSSGFIKQAPYTYIHPLTAGYLGIAAGAVLTWTASSVAIGVPLIGSGAPYGAHGTVTTVALTAAQNLVLSAAQYALDTMKVSTAAGGACTVTYPAATDAAGFKKYVWHVSGAGTVAVSNGTVTIAAALAAGQGAWFEFSVAGVAQLTPAFTVLVGA